MYSWELGFDAALSSEYPEILMELGFEKLSFRLVNWVDSNTQVFGFNLSWDGPSKADTLNPSW